MLIEPALIKLMSTRSNYRKYYHLIPKTFISDETFTILKFLRYKYENTNEDFFDLEKLKFEFVTINLANAKDEIILWYNGIFDQAAAVEETSDTILKTMEERVAIQRVTEAINKGQSILEIKKILEDSDFRKVDADIQPITQDLDELIAFNDRKTHGYKWRINSINEQLAPLLIGDCGIIAAHVGTGKTSFIASEITYLARGLDKPILWFNNEGRGEIIQMRLITACLNRGLSLVIENKDIALKEYHKKMGGDKIKVFDVHRRSVTHIEQIIEKYDPGIVIIDMLDKVSGFESRASETSDMRYERLYDWANDIAATQCPVLVTSQLSSDTYKNEELRKYPTVDCLRGSRNAKQGAVRFMLMVGHDDPQSSVRYLSCPKEKVGSENPLRCQVNFNRVTGRFSEPSSEVF